MPRVFISRATPDDEHAVRALALLEREGLDVWIAPRDVPTQLDYGTAIVRAMPDCKAMLLLLSDDAMKSRNVERELELAWSGGLLIFALALPRFSGLHTLTEFFDYRIGDQVRLDGDVAALVREIREKLPDEPAPRPSPEPLFAAPTAQPAHGPPPVPRSFLGEDRHRQAAELLRCWDEVRRGEGARLVALLGETGFGKTRIVQEFYRQLALGQPDPPFWPYDLTATAASGGRALRESRKRIAPTEIHPDAGARATYLWLGHVVDEGHQGRVDTGLEHLGRGLATSLSLAAAGDPGGQVANMTRRALGDEVTPGSDMAVHLAELLHRGPATSGAPVTPRSVEAFWQGLRHLWTSSDVHLPTVIAIEDAHYAGPETVHALEQLASSGLPFLAVLCAQESQLGEGTQRRPLGRLIDQELPTATLLRLEKLTSRDVEALFLEALPNLEREALLEAVTKVDGNPYHAHTLLVEMRRAADHGRLDADWVSKRPSTFEGELLLQWKLLPDDVRRLLSGIAVLGTQVPERIGLHALRSVSPHGAVAIEASLQSGWLRRLQSDEALRFLERSRWVIANHESVEEWAPAERRRIISEALRTLESVAGGQGLIDPMLQQLHLALALSANGDGISFDRVAAVRSGLAAALRLRLASDDNGSLEVARDTESLVVGHDRDPGMAELAVESALALRLAVPEALSAFDGDHRVVKASELATNRAERVAARRPDLAARAYAFLSIAHRVRFDEAAMASCTEALRLADEWFGLTPAPDATTKTDVLRAHALHAKGLGDNLGAATHSNRRLDVLEATYSPLDRRVLGAMQSTAFYWGRIDVERAIQLRRTLVDRRVRIWGDERNTQVATAQKELAVSYARRPEQDMLEEAHALAERSLETATLLRGARSRAALLATGAWLFTACRLSDQFEFEGDLERAAAVREAALTKAVDMDGAGSGIEQSRVLNRQQRLGECAVRLGDARGVAVLRDVLASRLPTGHDTAEHPVQSLDIEVLWLVAELVAGLWRLGSRHEAEQTAERFGLVRHERWPAQQPRGWQSTRPQDQHAGVL